jgi:hypothetical protein
MNGAGSDDSVRRASLAEATRVLRPGGRVVVIDGARSTGWLRSRTGATRQPPEAVLALLERAGLKARRQLADADSIAYYEARKPS